MKNRFKLNILIITFCSVFSVYSFSDELIFNTSEINVSEKGNIIEATDGTVTTTEGSFTIKAEKFYYDNKIVKMFAFATILWGIVGMLVGLLVAFQIYF